MTFEEWWKDAPKWVDERDLVKSAMRDAWEAATLAERDACARWCDENAESANVVGEFAMRDAAAAIRAR